jgi:hypothetical protein
VCSPIIEKLAIFAHLIAAVLILITPGDGSILVLLAISLHRPHRLLIRPTAAAAAAFTGRRRLLSRLKRQRRGSRLLLFNNSGCGPTASLPRRHLIGGFSDEWRFSGCGGGNGLELELAGSVATR